MKEIYYALLCFIVAKRNSSSSILHFLNFGKLVVKKIDFTSVILRVEVPLTVVFLSEPPQEVLVFKVVGPITLLGGLH